MFEYEDPDDGGAGDTAPVADAAPDTGGDAWDGAWETVADRSWRKDIPDADWTHIEKMRNEGVEARERASLLDRLLGADDARGAVAKEIDDLKAKLAEAETTGRTSTEKLAKMEADIAAKEAEAKSDAEWNHIAKTYPDLVADFEVVDGKETGAMVKFAALVAKGFDMDEAATMARAFIKPKAGQPAAAPGAAPASATAEPAAPAAKAPPAAKRVVPMSRALEAMSAGGNNAASVESANDAGDTLGARMKKLRARAAAADAVG